MLTVELYGSLNKPILYLKRSLNIITIYYITGNEVLTQSNLASFEANTKPFYIDYYWAESKW